MRRTIRFNEQEEIELSKLQTLFHINNPSEAVKMAVFWVNNYLQNVAHLFYPPNFDVVLIKKKKTMEVDRKVYDK